MTYTVRAQGRLLTAEEFGEIVVRSDPGGSVVRLRDVARIELGALNYQQIAPRERPAGARSSPSSRRPDRTRSTSPTASGRPWRTSRPASRPTWTTPSPSTRRLPVTEGIREILETLLERDAAGDRSSSSSSSRTGAPRSSRWSRCRSRSSARSRSSRCSVSRSTRSRCSGWCWRSGWWSTTRSSSSRRCEHHIEEGMSPRDATLQAMREVSGPGGGHRAGPLVGVHPGGVHERHPGPAEQAVRGDHRDLGLDLGVQRADAVARRCRRCCSARASERTGRSPGSSRWFNRAFDRGDARLRAGQPRAHPQGRARRGDPGRCSPRPPASGQEAADQLPARGGPGLHAGQHQLPPAASLERTDAVVARRSRTILARDRGRASYNTVVGFSLLTRVTATLQRLLLRPSRAVDERGAGPRRHAIIARA